MHAVGLMGLACGPAASMRNQFTVASQACGGLSKQPECHLLAQTMYGVFVMSAYSRELDFDSNFTKFSSQGFN